MDENLSVAVEALRKKAASQAEILRSSPEMGELIKIHAALNTIEDLCGAERTGLSDLLGVANSSKPIQREPLVRVGEFFGKQPLEAAKIYLRKKGQPANFNEIVDNLAFGSCEVVNKNELRVSLGRSTFEIAKLSEDDFGLLDWYPDVKKTRLDRPRKRLTLTPSDEGEGQNTVPVG